MVSVDRTAGCTPDGHLVLLFRGVDGRVTRVCVLLSPSGGFAAGDVASGEVAEWQTRTVQVRVPERA